MWEMDIFVEMKGNCKWGIGCNLSWKWDAMFTVSSATVFKLPDLDIWLLTSLGYQCATRVGTTLRNSSLRRSRPKLTAGRGSSGLRCWTFARKGGVWIAVQKAELPHCSADLPSPWKCSLVSGKLSICGNLNFPEWNNFPSLRNTSCILLCSKLGNYLFAVSITF